MQTKKEILSKIAELQALADTLPDGEVWESQVATDPSKKAYIGYQYGNLGFKIPDIDFIKKGFAYKNLVAAELDCEYNKLVIQMKIFIMDAWNEFGAIPDWSNHTIGKYCLILEEGQVVGNVYTRVAYNFIHLPTQVDRGEFRSKFTDFEIKLVLTMGVW